MSSKSVDQLTREKRRQQEREERRRKREQAKITASVRTSIKDRKLPETDSTIANGRTKKPVSSKRTTVPVYNKISVIEKTAKFDSSASDTKSKADARAPKVDASKRIGNKFKDRLSKFESQAKPSEKEKKSAFVRSQNGRPSQSSADETSATKKRSDAPAFRRSYRTSRSEPIVDDPTVHNRRSLRSEKVADSVAKLERQSSTDDGVSDKKKSTTSRSKSSSASSSKTSLSESTAATAKNLSRSQQALERHKMRMRSTSQGDRSSSPGKPSSPVTKTSKKSDSPKKHKKERKSETAEGEKTKTISVTSAPADGDTVEVTTVTEVVSETEEKMNVVIKEVTVNKEETEQIMSPETTNEPGDPEPVSVQQTVAMFDKQGNDDHEEPNRSRRQHPSEPDENPVLKSADKKLDTSPERRTDQEVVVIETTTVIQSSGDPPSGLQSSHDSNQESEMSLSDTVGGESESMDTKASELHSSDTTPSQPSAISPEEAINLLQRLSDEVHSSKKSEVPTVGDHKTLDEDKEKSIKSEPENRPTSLHIEELLYVTESPPEPQNQPKEDLKTAHSAFASALEVFSHSSAHSSGTSSPIKSSAELSSTSSDSQKLELSSSETLSSGGSSPRKCSPTKLLKSDFLFSKVHSGEESSSRDPTPEIKSGTSFPKTPDSQPQSPVKSPVSTVESLPSPAQPTTPAASPSSPVKSPSSPVKPAPVKSRVSPPKSPTSPVKAAASPVKSPESPVQTPASPVKSPDTPASSPIADQDSCFYKRTPEPSSPAKSISEIKEIFERHQIESEQETKLTESTGVLSNTSSRSRSPEKTSTRTKSTPSEEISSRNPIVGDQRQSPTSNEPPETLVLENSDYGIKLPAKSSTSTRSSSRKSSSSHASSITKSRKSSVRSPSPQPANSSTSSEPSRSKTTKKRPSSEDPERDLATYQSEKKSSTEAKMLATRSARSTPRYKKSWLDESDDDDISVLSDAASDASSIDMDWLGPDSDDEYFAKKSKKSSGEPTSVQRSASSAQDMLKMWEKKVHEPEKTKTNATEKLLGDSLKRVGSVRSAWESGLSDNSSESKKSIDGYSSPSKSPKRSIHNSPLRDASFHSTSSKESQEEIKDRQEIFGDTKTSEKINGAKAMFENLSQSPRRSPLRSPRKRAEPLSDRSDSQQYSSVSQDSSSSQVSDGTDDSPKVDNMRAMFESQNEKKSEGKKQKTFEEDERKSGKKPLSKVQRRAASRRQEKKRSMTQPVTTDDVMKAQDIMKESLKPSSDNEEEELNFVDRLKFFTQLAKNTSNKPKVRHRSDTQPVKSSHIVEATRQFEEKQKTDSAKSKKERPPPILDPSKLAPITSSSISKSVRKFSQTSSEGEDSVLSASSTTNEPERGKKKLFSSSEDESRDMSVRLAEIKTTGSIHDRMKKLQKNQTNEKWKKQGKNSQVKASVSERLNSLKGQEDKWKRSSNAEATSSVDKLSNRIAKMKENSETWKGRTGQQNDAAQFTVQAKLAKREGKKVVAVLPSPVIKRRVLPDIVPIQKVVSVKDAKANDNSASMSQLSFVERLANKGLEENVIKTTEVHTTEVPTIDHEEFDKFFGISEPVNPTITNGYHEDIENLPTHENITRLSDIGRLKSSVKVQAKRRSSKRNPLKALAARTDLKLSYDTERSNVVKLEQQRIASQRGHAANFTSAALAGLAAKADLKKVSLRSTKNTPMLSNDDLKPFQDVMLVRAKGRRNVRTTLVEPTAKSLCSDDAFLLVTPTKLFGWFGEYCNVIERAKINEIADYIVIKGDLGCKVNHLKSIEENSNPDLHPDFWKILGGQTDWDRSLTEGVDEQYEVDVETTVKTYKMIDSKLVPFAEAWGKLPKMSMLEPADTFVFDFGAEMYIWQGKAVSFADRRLAVRLARVLWEQDYDYTKEGICPFHAKELTGERPKFGLFARVNENLETSLFQEKFCDWSNIYRETGKEVAALREDSRGKAIADITTKSDIVVESKPCDVTKMIENSKTHIPVVIDGYDIACFGKDLLDEDGRVLEIATEETEHYYVTESGVEKIDDSVLHRENCYVIKWKYSIQSTGQFATSGTTNNSATPSGRGRSKVAYFSWNGPDSAIKKKGTSALIASTMETGNWPVISFNEWTTPPVFNKCFHGKLVIANGKRGERRGGYIWKLFQVQGSAKDSAALSEVPCECKSLRSCSSFVALHARDVAAFVWHGCRSPKTVKDAAESAVEQLSSRMPKSIPFRRGKTSIEVTVCEEGEEPESFWTAIGIKRRNRYECLVDSSLPTRTTRGWRFDIVSGEFSATELEPVDPGSFLPLHQNQLVHLEKPCLVLIDCTHAVFLWENCGDESLAASAKRRWDVIRRLSIETTINYCKEHSRDEAAFIEAGSEPSTFTNAFSRWISADKLVVRKQKAANLKPVSEILSTLTRLTYSIDELRSNELPDGVDARNLETYLSNEDFEKLFEMTKLEFYEFPIWKQIKLRQEKDFF